MWYSSSGKSAFPRSPLSLGDGGAGMLPRIVGVTLSQHSCHIGIVGYYEWLQGNFSNIVCRDPSNWPTVKSRKKHTAHHIDSTNHIFCFQPLAERVFVVFLPLFIMYVMVKQGVVLCLLPWSFCPQSLFFASGGKSVNRSPKLDTDEKTQRESSHTVPWENPRHIEVSRMQIHFTLGTFYFCFSDTDKYTWLGDLLNKTPPRDLGVNKH